MKKIELEQELARAEELIGTLEERLQEAHDEIARTNSDLLQLTLELEERVAHRTAELVKANKALREEIVQRSRTEKALSESEVKFRQLAESIGDVFFALDSRLRCVYWNRTSELLTGISTQKAMGRSIWGIFPETKGTIVEEAYLKVMKSGQAQNFVTHLSLRGQEYVFEIGAYPTANGLAVLARDITERQWAEEALRESEERYRDLYENAPNAYFSVSATDGSIIRVNQEAARMTGYDRSSLLGMKVFDLYADTASGFGKAIDVFSRFTAGEAIRGIELEMKKRDGSFFWASHFVEPLRDGKGNIVASRSVAVDISERKNLEMLLRQAQKMEAIGTLAGGIAHDFNNILTPILGFSQLAMDDLPQEHPGRTKLGHVVKAAQRAKELVHQILAFSRQRSQEFRPVFLAPVIKEPLKLLRASIPTTIEIRQNIQSPDGQVTGDATQIHQVVMNLCTNAAHAMHEKGGTLCVSLTEVELGPDRAARDLDLKPGPYLKLTVSDTGQGMKPETMKRIFEPYFTTKATGEGTGMGLAVVHGIVASHGGVITVESEVDRGSTFDVYLPRLAAKVEEEVQEATPLPGHKERILFVDDEELVAELGREMLQRLEYQVTVLTESLAALEAFRADPEGFDLVLTDQSMPHLNGFSLAREILKIRSDIPVIMYTGLIEETVEEKAKAAGIRAVLAKPPDQNQLAEILRGQLRKRD